MNDFDNSLEEFDAQTGPQADASGRHGLVRHSSAAAPLALVVVSGATVGELFEVSEKISSIGRGAGVSIKINDGAISSLHATIRRSGEGCMVEDGGSTNGTFINGKRLAPRTPTPLMVGESLQVAETILVLMPAGTHSLRKQNTQQLQRVQPSFPTSTVLHPTVQTEEQLILQLLQGQLPAPPAPKASLDDQVAKLIDLLRPLKRLVARYFALAAVFTGLGALIGLASLLVVPPETQATFIMTVSEGDLSRLDNRQNSEAELAQFLTQLQQAFTSTSAIQATMEALGWPTASGQVDRASKKLAFDSIGLRTFRGSFANTSADLALRFLDLHLQRYLDEQTSRSVEGIQRQVDFLQQRLGEKEAELRSVELKLRDFKQKHLEVLPENSTEHMASRETLLARRSDLSTQASQAQLDLQVARRQLAEATPLARARLDAGSGFESRIQETQQNLAAARASGLAETNPRIVSLKKELQNLEEMKAKAQRSTNSEDLATNSDYVALRHRVDALEVAAASAGAALGEVNSQVARYDRLVAEMPEVEAEYAELMRTYTANGKLHEELYSQLKDAQLRLELERASSRARFQIAVPPSTGAVPIRRISAQRAGIGLVLGLFFAGAIAAFREARRWLRELPMRRASALVSSRSGAPHS